LSRIFGSSSDALLRIGDAVQLSLGLLCAGYFYTLFNAHAWFAWLC
jgi:hypothetical protein